MAIESISATTRSLAVNAYATVQQTDRQDDQRKARQKQEPTAADDGRQDQVTFSAQVAQAQNTAASAPVRAAQASEESRGEDQRERNREEVALASKSVAQALTAYRQTSLL